MKDEKSRTPSIEQARAELQRIMVEFFAEVAKEINGGKSYDVAVMDVCKARPDLIDRDNHLRDYIKGLSRAAQSVGIAELSASVAPRSDDVFSEVDALGEQKLAASEGRMDYGAALKAVLGERPDLERRYKDEARRKRI
jgi:hypothetical protein